MASTRVIHEQVLGASSVAFDEHAERRMRQRAVTEDEVLDVLRQPEQTGLPTQANRQRYRRRVGGRLIDVVFELDPTQVVVFTVMVL